MQEGCFSIIAAFCWHTCVLRCGSCGAGGQWRLHNQRAAHRQRHNRPLRGHRRYATSDNSFHCYLQLRIHYSMADARCTFAALHASWASLLAGLIVCRPVIQSICWDTRGSTMLSVRLVFAALHAPLASLRGADCMQACQPEDMLEYLRAAPCWQCAWCPSGGVHWRSAFMHLPQFQQQHISAAEFLAPWYFKPCCLPCMRLLRQSASRADIGRQPPADLSPAPRVAR